MLPGSSPERVDREAAKGKQSGRTQEIQRLIGRSLRAATDLRAMPDVQLTVDCDVLQADGGTRTASICGGWIALHDACSRLLAKGTLARHPVLQPVAAISVGVIDGTPMLDLEYTEDVRAEVDMNVVMTGDGRFVEVQGTAEGVAFTRAELDALLGLAESGIAEIVAAQQEMVAEAPTPAMRLMTASAVAAGAVDAQRRQGPRDRRDPRRAERRADRRVRGRGRRHDDRVPARRSPSASPPRWPRSRRSPPSPTSRRRAPRSRRTRGSRRPRSPRPSGVLAIADDTGLEVDALDGAPGVYAARYAGADATYADNVAKLLRELEGVYPALRTARFATVAIACWPDGREVAVRGEVEGVIAADAAGESGFGYDPVFVPTEGDGRTFAQMTAAEKHAISHRGRAFATLARALST